MGFLDAIIAFPTVFFTVPVGLSLAYWLMVIVGAAELDVFGLLSGGDGAAEGLIEAGGEGIVEAGADAVAEAGAEAAGDSMVDGAIEAGMLASFLRLGKVPLTITLSLISIIGWVTTGVTMSLATGLLPAGLVGIVAKAGIGVAALGVASWTTRLITTPLQHLGHRPPPSGGKHLVGKRAVLVSQDIGEKRGQAELTVDDAHILVLVRSKSPNTLKRGDELLLVGWDEATGKYEAESLAALLHDIDHADVSHTDNSRQQVVAMQSKSQGLEEG